MALSMKEFNAWLMRCGTQVEVAGAKHYDDERALISPYDYQGLFLHDVKVGILKGSYRFGKGLVGGVADLGILAYKVHTKDPETQQKIMDFSTKAVKESGTYLFGTKEELKDQNDRFVKFLEDTYQGIEKKVKDDWAQAGKDGKKTELISLWTTQGILNIASFFVGAGEIKEATSAGKVVELAEEGEAVGTEAARMAEAAKGAEAEVAEWKALVKAAAKKAGMSEDAASTILQIAKDNHVQIRMRPTNPDALKLIKDGHPPKPAWLHSKSIKPEDVLLGAKGEPGEVGFFEPKLPDYVDRLDPKYKKLVERYDERMNEFKALGDDMRKLTEDGKIRVENGVVKEAKMVTDENGLVADFGKSFTGDYDIFDITGPNGEPLSDREAAWVVNEMMKDPDIRAMHPHHMSWDPVLAKDEVVDQNVLKKHSTAKEDGGEMLVDFSPDGAVTQSSGPAERPSSEPRDGWLKEKARRRDKESHK